MIPTTSSTNAVQPPRRPRYRPEVPPPCQHCGRLGPCGYSLHVGGLCVRLVADHDNQAELIGGVRMRPVELMVNGDHRWVWTRSDVSAMDVDDLVTLHDTFQPVSKPPRRVVDGGAGKRPEPVALFTPETSSPPPPSAQPRRLTIPAATMTTASTAWAAVHVVTPTVGPSW